MLERRYSNIVELIDVGRSYEGRHLIVIKVSLSVSVGNGVLREQALSACRPPSKVKKMIKKLILKENESARLNVIFLAIGIHLGHFHINYAAAIISADLSMFIWVQIASLVVQILRVSRRLSPLFRRLFYSMQRRLG